MPAPSLQLRRTSTSDKRPSPTILSSGEIAINYHSDTAGIFFKDSQGALVKCGPVEVSDTAPNTYFAGVSGNSVGELWFDHVNDLLKVWDGSVWRPCYKKPTGWTGTFQTSSDQTVTVVDGVITGVV